MFCTNCGNQLADSARFCTKCGNPMGSQAAPTQPSPAPSYNAPTSQTQEQVHLVLNVQRKMSMFKLMPCSIVFMSDRLVLAYLTKERQKMESDRVSQEIKASGKGFFKGSAAMMSYWSDYHKKYYNMSSSQILAEETENIMIYYNTISKFLFHAYYTDYASDGSQRTSGGQINISLAGGETLKFSHTMGNNRDTQNILTQLLGNRLKYKR